MSKRKLDTADKIIIGLWVVVGVTVIASLVGTVMIWLTFPPTTLGLLFVHGLMTSMMVAVDCAMVWFVWALQKGLNG